MVQEESLVSVALGVFVDIIAGLSECGLLRARGWNKTTLTESGIPLKYPSSHVSNPQAPPSTHRKHVASGQGFGSSCSRPA